MFDKMGEKKYRLRNADKRWWKQNINCLHACPAHTNVPHYISLIAEEKFQEAFNLNRKANVFPAILGRICMHPCETACRRGHIDEPVAICALKRAAADHKPEMDRSRTPFFSRNQRRLAIVGAGPAGLTTADDLARMGYKVTVFEALPVAGGMLNVGIPPYRLCRTVIQKAIEELEQLGVEIRLNTAVGKAVTLEQLQSRYHAVLIAAGAHEAVKLNIPGEGLTGVLHGVTFMRKVNLHEQIPLGLRVAVIGGGNTAVDCARSARYLGAEEVTIIYRRTRDEMPVTAEEVAEAEEEGVKVDLLVSPIRVIGNQEKEVVGLECIRNRLIEPDDSGRPRPVPIQGSEFVLEVDTVLPAVSQSPDTSFLPEIFSRSKWGLVEVDPKSLMTNIKGVFAVGDYATGPRDVISVIADAHRVSAAIHGFLQGALRAEKGRCFKQTESPHAVDSDFDALPRQKMPVVPAKERRKIEAEVQLGFSPETAVIEAKRCLRCDYNIMVDSKRCILCAGCVDVCPYGCIQLIPLDEIERDKAGFDLSHIEQGALLVLDETYCIRCGLCMRRCPTGAIVMERFEISTPVHS
ncbi:MAG: FAD-dependent oxidoreductase [Desulfobacteraceae bacterium]|jgi:formate dehydrogenase major subunit